MVVAEAIAVPMNSIKVSRNAKIPPATNNTRPRLCPSRVSILPSYFFILAMDVFSTIAAYIPFISSVSEETDSDADYEIAGGGGDGRCIIV